MRLGVLTGGGDCPGLNAVIRAIVRTGAQRDVTFVGFQGGWRGGRGGEATGPERRRDVTFVGFQAGWRGVLDDETTVLDPVTARGILHRGGTILGSSGV